MSEKKESVLFLAWKFRLEAEDWLLMAEEEKSKKQRQILWRKAFFSFKIDYNRK